MTCLFGLRAADLYGPGADPAWWSAADNIAEFTRAAAENWVVGHMQEVVDSLDRQATRRASALNLGLKYGAVASSLIALAGVLAMFR